MCGTRHGVVSLVLIVAAHAVGLIGIATASITAAVAYLAAVAAAVPVILFAYCAKCPERLTGCRHVIPGPLTRYLPSRQTGPYTVLDYAGLVLPLALLVGAPQPFLWQRPVLLIAFWSLAVVGVLEIRLYVCAGCRNRFCPLRKP